MSEQHPAPTPEQPDAYQQILTTVKEAAAELPKGVATIDRDYPGQTVINGYDSFVQHSTQDAASPDVAIGHARIGESVGRDRTASEPDGARGVYGFVSTEQGIEKAQVRRVTTSRDAITRAGDPNHAGYMSNPRKSAYGHLYEHSFGPASRDKVGKLVTGMVVGQARRKASGLDRRAA